MDNDIFKAGVQPGGPTSHDEIKMLICYILTRIEAPMRFSQLHEALQENGLVNYFQLVQVVEELAKSGHLAVEAAPDGERYTATEAGRQAGGEFERALPYSVRQKALQAAAQQLRREKREAELRIDIRKGNGGYYMDLAIPEQGGTLASFSLFLPTREECELVRRRFLNDPVFIYKGVLALLTGDREVLGELFPGEQEALF